MDNQLELFPIVDETGNVIGSATRGEFHSGSKLLHPVVHLHVFNSKGDIYLQRRPDWKDIQPGKWDTAVGGHVDYGETPEQALQREVRSGACQFYIVTRQEGTPHLDGKYTVFGEVKEGMEVADSIQSSATDKYDRPLEDIRILSVVVPEEPKVEPKQSTKPSRPAKKRPRIK